MEAHSSARMTHYRILTQEEYGSLLAQIETLRDALDFSVETIECSIVGGVFNNYRTPPITYRCLRDCKAAMEMSEWSKL